MRRESVPGARAVDEVPHVQGAVLRASEHVGVVVRERTRAAKGGVAVARVALEQPTAGAVEQPQCRVERADEGGAAVV